MKQIEYNLLEERWVRVRGQDYTVQEVSLPDALLHAPDPEKQANQPGIVVYLAGEGETLWDICKKYDVPMDGMREMNNLTQDEIRPGDQLLIVKGYAVDKETQIV